MAGHRSAVRGRCPAGRAARGSGPGRPSILPWLLALQPPVLAGDLRFGYTPRPGPGEKPALMVTPPRRVAEMVVDCQVGGRTLHWEQGGIPGGETRRFSWPRDERVTHADCTVRAVFADGMVEELQVPVDYAFTRALRVDLAHAFADVGRRVLSVSVDAPVDRAEVVAYGAGRVELDRREVALSSGPGRIEVPWVGDPADVVLLDVTLHSGGAWAGFTYSPWFLDIPHDDVLFDTDSDRIPPGEEWKLQRTLELLRQVEEKYGDLVPVHLYVAGCTDTVGSAAHNLDLSMRRARSIAAWLVGHGYDGPVAYHGFGEGWLARPTGDGVDEQANRRAVYIVAASPPPPGSGVPQVRWTPLGGGR